MIRELLADVAKLQYHLEEARGLAKRVSKHDYAGGNDISAVKCCGRSRCAKTTTGASVTCYAG